MSRAGHDEKLSSNLTPCRRYWESWASGRASGRLKMTVSNIQLTFATLRTHKLYNNYNMVSLTSVLLAHSHC